MRIVLLPMKRNIISAAAILIGMTCLAQNKAIIGLDLRDILRAEGLNLNISYAFHDKWSVAGHAEASINLTHEVPDDDYVMHLSEFETLKLRQSGSFRLSAGIQYWLAEAFKGGWIEIGCRYGRDVKPALTVGAGYEIPIWKGLRIYVSCRTDITGDRQENLKETDGISAGIQWIFKTR